MQQPNVPPLAAPVLPVVAAAAAVQHLDAAALTPQERLRGLYTEFAISQRQKKILIKCPCDKNDDNEHGLGMLDNEGLEWARDAANKQKDFFMFKANYMLRRKGINSLLFFGGDESEEVSARRALDATCNAGEGHEGSGRNKVQKTNRQEYYAHDQYIRLWFILTCFSLFFFGTLSMTNDDLANEITNGELTFGGLIAAWSFCFAAVLFVRWSYVA